MKKNTRLSLGLILALGSFTNTSICSLKSIFCSALFGAGLLGSEGKALRGKPITFQDLNINYHSAGPGLAGVDSDGGFCVADFQSPTETAQAVCCSKRVGTEEEKALCFLNRVAEQRGEDFLIYLGSNPEALDRWVKMAREEAARCALR